MRILPLTINKQLIPQTMDGRKLRTRRLLTPQPTDPDYHLQVPGGRHIAGPSALKYQPGDILYVREEHYAYGYWQDVEGEFTNTGKQKRAFHVYNRVGFPTPPKEYTFDLPENLGKLNENGTGWYKRLARFMPKKYARIFLEVTDVRIERLGDIADTEGEDEYLAEGVEKVHFHHGFGYKSYQIIHEGRHKGEANPHAAIPNASPLTSFKELWEALNGPESWDANPWVWVLSFNRTTKPDNFL